MLISCFIQNGSQRKTSRLCTPQRTVVGYCFRQLPIDFAVCLADPNMPDLLCIHSRQMCCFQNSNIGRIAVWNMELNTDLALTVSEMVILTLLSARMFCKTSLYMLTDCSAACRVRMDGLTPPHGLRFWRKTCICIFCTQGAVDKYFG